MDKQEFLKLFIEESEDHITVLRDALLKLEQEPNNKSVIDALFRAAHSLKGAANTMGFDPIGKVSHAAEDMIDTIRKGEHQPDSSDISLLLNVSDILENFINNLRAGDTSTPETEPMVHKLRDHMKTFTKRGAQEPKKESKPATPPAPPTPPAPAPAPPAAKKEEAPKAPPPKVEEKKVEATPEPPKDTKPSASPLGDLMSAGMLNDFVDEAQEHLRNINSDLLALEEAGANANPDTINSAFRAIHTIKGVSGMLGLTKISDLSHELEHLLNEVRRGNVIVTSEIANGLFAGLDVLAALIEDVAMGRDMKADIQPAIKQIKALVAGQSGAPKPAAPVAAPSAPAPAPAVSATTVSPEAVSEEERKQVATSKKEGKIFYRVSFNLQKDCLSAGKNMPDLVKELESIGTVLRTFMNLRDVPALEKIDAEQTDITVGMIVASVVTEEILQMALTIDNAKVEQLKTEADVYKALSDVKLLTSMPTAVFKKPTAAPPTKAEPVHAPAPQTSPPKSSTPAPTPQPADPGAFKTEKDVTQTVRVEASKLDKILSQVGELVVVRARYAHAAARALELLRGIVRSDWTTADSDEDILAEQRKLGELQSGFGSVDSDLARLLSDLQDSVMSARMVPIGNVFSKFKRLIRDLSTNLNKKLKLDIIGEETELDKKVIDEIGDPLTHLVRNAADHGVESVEKRRAAGKPETGTITLSAVHQGDCILIEVRDDGGGLNRDKIVKKAVERGLVTLDNAQGMSDREVYRLVLEPGFSTAERVTEVSGRGVGMDVVVNSLEKLKGTLEIDSVFGEGSRFLIKLPLTLAIIDALLVKVESETYAIPISSVQEILEVEPTMVRNVEHQECVALPDMRNLPLARLRDVLDIKGNGDDLNALGKLYTVVADSPYGQIGIIVQDIVGQEEVVIKALSQRFERVRGISGASILGDGSVCLILDVFAMVDLVVKTRNSGMSLRKTRVGV